MTLIACSFSAHCGISGNYRALESGHTDTTNSLPNAGLHGNSFIHTNWLHSVLSEYIYIYIYIYIYMGALEGFYCFWRFIPKIFTALIGNELC